MKNFIEKLSPKMKNIIITAALSVIVAAVSIVCSINFVKHTNYEVDYVIRDDLFTLEHISDYSPTIKGTEGDSTIYKNFGKKNSVLVTKKVFNSIDEVKSSSLAIDLERFEYEAFENGKAMLFDISSLDKETTQNGFNKVKDGTYDAFICSFENAKELVKNTDYFISNLEIELFPKILLLGGTHPYEASGFLTATMILENMDTERGIFYLINEANAAGFNYEQTNEARQQTFEIPLVDKQGNVIGSRTFKIGSRFAHLTQQWPTPDMYVHPSGQSMTNTESRNLNRVHPGDPNGNFTERVAYGIRQLIKENNITLVVDLHEASPEYLTNDAIVYHQDTSPLVDYMWRKGLRYVNEETGKKTRLAITTEFSDLSMHGLSHRELGDYTNAFVILCESSDVYEGRLHGPLTADLITYYDHNDKFYEYINNLSLEERAKYVDYWYSPDPIDVRVARHTLAIQSFIDAYNNQDNGPQQRSAYGEYCKLDEAERHTAEGQNYTGKLIINNIPSYEDLVKYQLGAYLLNVE